MIDVGHVLGFLGLRLSCGLVLLFTGSPVAAGETVDLPWHSLSFKASKLGLTARSTIAVEPQGTARTELIAAPGQTVMTPGAGALLLTEETSFGGRNSLNRIWFDGDSGETQQREVLETGKRQRKKVNRYSREGILSLRLNPTKAERGRPLAEWTDRTETFYPFIPTNETDESSDSPPRHIIEPGSLLYLIAAGGVRHPGQSQTFYIVSDQRLIEVEARALAKTTASVDFQLNQGGKVRRVAESQLPALEIALRATQGESDSAVKLLGLEGDVRILLDVERRLPLEVSGRVKYLGRVRVRLQEAVID